MSTPDEHEMETPLGVTVSVFKSVMDGATVVQLDTTFEPDTTDFRVYLNDATLHEGTAP